MVRTGLILVMHSSTLKCGLLKLSNVSIGLKNVYFCSNIGTYYQNNETTIPCKNLCTVAIQLEDENLAACLARVK